VTPAQQRWTTFFAELLQLLNERAPRYGFEPLPPGVWRSATRLVSGEQNSPGRWMASIGLQAIWLEATGDDFMEHRIQFFLRNPDWCRQRYDVNGKPTFWYMILEVKKRGAEAYLQELREAPKPTKPLEQLKWMDQGGGF